MTKRSVDRLACVSLPAFPLQLLLLSRPEWNEHPVAVVDRDEAQGRILWINEEAWQFRLRPGMRYAAALSLCRELRAGVVSEQDIAEQLTNLLPVLRNFSPNIEASKQEPGVFWIDASGFERLFPDLLEWAKAIQTRLESQGLRSVLAIGFTRFHTYAVARSIRIARGAQEPTVQIFRTQAEERGRARAVGLERLHLAPRLLEQLSLLDVHSVGDFAALPHQGIAKRFGPEATALHELASEHSWDPLVADTEVQALKSSMILDDPVSDSASLCFLARRLLSPLLQLAAERSLAVAGIELSLSLEHSLKRKASPQAHQIRETIRAAEATLEESILIDLLRLRLEALRLKSKANQVELKLETVPASPRQIELFEKRPRRDPAAAARALARLRAELGEDCVVTAVIEEGHLPEARFSWCPWKQLPKPLPAAVHRPPLVRRLLPHASPLPLHLLPPLGSGRNLRPGGRDEIWRQGDGEVGRIEDLQGPYVVSGGWWRREIHRAYHFAQTDRGQILWLYYDRARRRWFLQGQVE